MDGLWTVCPKCGAVIADTDLHEQWHAALAAESEA